MADVNANIGVHIDTSAALAELKNLQRQLANFHASISKGSAASAMAQKSLQTNLLNSINATGKFTAQMGLVRTSTESFTHALEKNKLGMRDYFRYAGASTKSFGRLFKQEFDTINKVAEDRVKKMQTQYIKMGRDASGAMKAMAITPTSLNMKDYATQTAMAAQKQALFNQLVRQGSTNLLNFGKNTQWAGRQLMVGFTIPLAYFGTTAAKTFMELEKQALRFRRVYGDMFTTTEETNKAIAEIEQLAKSFTKYGVEVAKTMEMAASAAAMGKQGAELTAQVAQATRLAVLGGVEQEQALETTISLTNAFGIAAEDLAQKINFLNSVENQTVVSIEDLTIAIPKAGPVVQQLGGDVEDLAFFLTAMKEGGINASEGANALKSGLASLINPTKKASQMLKDMGINIKAIVEENQGDVTKTVIDFSKALDTLDPLNRARAIEQLFGKFQFSRLSTLFQNVTKDGTQASRVLQLAGASVEELAILSERELKAVEDAVGTNFKQAVEDLKVAIAPIGKTFLEAVTPIVRVVGDLIERFNNLGDGTKKFIVVATSLVGLIGPVLLMTFGLLANGLANIIKLFLALRTGFMKLGGNSKVLAEQTNYLNSEQLEAATVAASLNQAHTRLTQSFTAEASAVRALRQAYIDATVAAANFARSNPGMMMPGKGKTPKKFARGTTYVPGIGNKDNVPSVLTPGEAVIPRDVAQDPKFQPIIDALVSGKLQAFDSGSNNVQPFSNSPQFQPKIDLSGPSSNVLNTNPGQINRIVAGLPGLAPEGNEAFAARSARLLARMQAAKAARNSTATVSGSSLIFDDQVYNAKSARGAKGVKDFLDSLTKNPDGTYTYVDEKTKEPTTITSKRLHEVLNYRSQPGKNLTQSDIKRSLDIGSGARGSSRGTSRPAWIAKLMEEAKGNPNALAEEKAIKDALAKNGITNLSQEKQRNLFGLQASHIIEERNANGIKEWRAANIVPEPGYINNYINTVKGKLGKELLAMSDDTLKSLNIDRAELKKIASGVHPTTANAANTLRNIAQYQIGANPSAPGIYQARAVVAGIGYRMSNNSYKGGIKTLAQLFPTNKKVLQEIAVSKGETIQTTDGKTKKVTGQTGVPKPSNVRTRNTSDRRIIPTRGVARVIPRGRFGFMAGAAEGADLIGQTGTTVGAIAGSKQLSQAQLRAALEKTSVKEAKRRIKAEGKLTTSLEEQEKQTTDNTKKTKNLGGKIIGTANALTGLAIAGSFAGGAIGEMSQKILPFVSILSAVTMIMPMIKAGFLRLGALLMANPLFAVFTVAAALVVGFKILDNKNKKQAQAQSNYIDAISATTEKMKSVGQLTGKVGASEIMARRREGGTADKFTTQFERAGQQFGTNFLESEAGKSIFETFKTNLQKGGSDAVKKISLELSAYVSDGIISAEQANSVARSIGISLSDMTISSNIQGQLRQVLGPDGQDLATNPLKVRLEIIKGQTNEFKDVFDALTKDPNFKFDKTMAASLSALGVQSLEITQAQRDAQNKLYDDQLRSLQAQLLATTDKKKQVELENKISEIKTKQISDDTVLASKSKTAIDNQIRGFEAASKANGTMQAFFASLNQQVTNKFKDDPFLSAFFDASKNTKSQELEVSIKTLVGAGALTPKTSIDLLEMFGKNKEKELNTLIRTTFATQDPGKTQELINIAKSLGNKELGVEIITGISAAGEEGKFDDRLAALTLLQKLDGKEINLGLFLKENALGKLDKLIPMLNKVEKIKTPITKTIIQDFQNANPEMNLAGLIADWEKYKNLPDELKKTAIQTYVSIYKTITDENVGDMAKQEAKSRGLRGRAAAEFIKNYSDKDKLASLLNRELYPDKAAPTPVPGGKSGGAGDSGKRDTTLDDLLSKLKLYRDATINAQGGTKELMRVLGGTKEITAFNGLSQSLLAFNKNLNSEEFIDWLGGLDKAIQKGYVKISQTGKAILTDLGQAAQKAYNDVNLGAFQDSQVRAIRATKDQRDQYIRLKAAGVDTAQALELLGDANFVTALRGAKNTEAIKEAIGAYKKLQVELDKTLRLTNPQQYFKSQRDVAEEAFNVEERIAKLRHDNATRSLVDQVDANNKLIDAAQRRLEVDESIGNRRIDIINEEIAALERSLSLGIDKQIQDLDDESRRLSEDQTIIGNTVDQINKKYDEQEKALSRISDINQEIAAQEKDRLSLADAITQGDISAASQAVQEMRSRSASASASVAQELLGQVRDAEIAGVRGTLTGMTADQISARQYQIDRQNYTLSTQRLAVERQIEAKQEAIYQIEVKRQEIYKMITNLEDRNFALNEQIKKADEILQKELRAIDAQRQKWEQAQLAIDIANTKTKEFQDKLANANNILSSVSKLWNDLTDKNLKITLQKIEETISGGGSGGSVKTTSKTGNPTVDAAVDRANALTEIALATTGKEIDSAVKGAVAAGLTPTTIANAIVAPLQASGMSTTEALSSARYTGQALQYQAQMAAKAAATPFGQASSATDTKVKQQVANWRPGGLSMGGLVPKFFATGGFARGTDRIPAMLTPGEFVVRKNAVDNFGVNNLNKINDGSATGNSVYNYSVNIDVADTNASSADIARAVIGQIKYIDSQRIRGQR